MAVVTVVGSANLDVVLHVDEPPKQGETILAVGQEQGPGGKGFNQAVASSKAGVETRFVARLGRDTAGEFLRKELISAGLSDSYVEVDDAHPTGTAYIMLASNSENSIIVNAGANSALTAACLVDRAVGDVLLAQLEVPIRTVKDALVEAKKQGATTVLNAAPAHRHAGELFPLADIVVVNETEAGFFGGISRILQHAIQGVVLTRGARGAQWFAKDGAVVEVPAFRVTPVDTTGAGDAFCGALAAELARGTRDIWGSTDVCGDSIADLLVYASAAGALATTAVGAQAGVASDEQIREFLGQALVRA